MFLRVLNKKVKCSSTYDLIVKFLKAEYLAKQKPNVRTQPIDIRALQNNTLSSLSCGIVFCEFDAFIELRLRKNLTKSKNREVNFAYRNLWYEVKAHNNFERRRRLLNSYLKTSPRDFQTQYFKKLFYVRYLKT